MSHRKIRFIANEPGERDAAEYRAKIEQIRQDNDIPGQEDFVFVEVTVTDPSEFEAGLTVRGEVLHDRHRVLTLESSSIPNALAALLLHVRDTTGCTPHIYFEWTEAIPSPTSSASSSSARARWPRSPARCCARRRRTGSCARGSMWADPGAGVRIPSRSGTGA